jgi:tRNA G18 (ribose-2'-O)-methylase SpoU
MFGIGIENAKFNINLGTLMRSAYNFNANFVFTLGNRYRETRGDTVRATKSIPCFNFTSADDLIRHCNIPIIGVEITEDAKSIINFVHPKRCIYLLGAEDMGLSKESMKHCKYIISIPSNHCLNVSVAGGIIMYDRLLKGSLNE